MEGGGGRERSMEEGEDNRPSSIQSRVENNRYFLLLLLHCMAFVTCDWLPSVSLYLRHSYEGDWFLVLFVVLPASEVLQFVSQNLVHVCVCACVCVCVCACVCACVCVCRCMCC